MHINVIVVGFCVFVLNELLSQIIYTASLRIVVRRRELVDIHVYSNVSYKRFVEENHKPTHTLSLSLRSSLYISHYQRTPLIISESEIKPTSSFMDYKDPMIGRMNMHKSALENVSIFISSFLRGFIFGEGSYSFFYFQSLIN